MPVIVRGLQNLCSLGAHNCGRSVTSGHVGCFDSGPSGWSSCPTGWGRDIDICERPMTLVVWLSGM